MIDYKRMPEIIQERKLASNIKNDTTALTFSVKQSDSRSRAYRKVRDIQSDNDVSCADDYYDELMEGF